MKNEPEERAFHRSFACDSLDGVDDGKSSFAGDRQADSSSVPFGGKKTYSPQIPINWVVFANAPRLGRVV